MSWKAKSLLRVSDFLFIEEANPIFHAPIAIKYPESRGRPQLGIPGQIPRVQEAVICSDLLTHPTLSFPQSGRLSISHFVEKKKITGLSVISGRKMFEAGATTFPIVFQPSSISISSSSYSERSLSGRKCIWIAWQQSTVSYNLLSKEIKKIT